LEVVLRRLRVMKSEDQDLAVGTLVLLSGILGMEETVSARLKEVGMINVMENKVLGPLILQRMEQSEQKGRSEGQARRQTRPASGAVDREIRYSAGVGCATPAGRIR